MSVAVSPTEPAFACMSTLARIGIVLRRSTTLCTWASELQKGRTFDRQFHGGSEPSN